MDKFYKKFSLYLSSHNLIKPEDCDIYEYAIKITIHGLLNIITSILIGLFYGMVKECMCLLLTIFVLRKFTGGIHASKYIFCLIYSTLIMAISLSIINTLMEFCNPIYFFMIVIMAVVILCSFSPVDNKNKKLSKKEKTFYKCISIFMSVILLFLMYLSIDILSLFYSMGIGVIIVTFLLVIAQIVNIKGEYNGK